MEYKRLRVNMNENKINKIICFIFYHKETCVNKVITI